VLNRAAAFQLFGNNQLSGQTFKLEGANWLVVGVIDDGDAETPRIYAPASITGGMTDSLMVLLDNNMVNADYAISGLKQLGVYENNYAIVNLAAAAAVFGQRLKVGLYGAAILIILLLLRQCAGLLFSRLPLYREQLKQLYFSELLISQRAGLAKTALAALGLLSGVAALMALALRILTICLGWPGLLPPGHGWAMGGFAAKLTWLHDTYPWGMALFLLLLLALALILVLAWPRPALIKEEKHGSSELT
jgi:hypothetical protein